MTKEQEARARLDAFLARCRQCAREAKAPLPAPPKDAPPPPKPWTDTDDKEIE